jgi:hypothetical protein
MKREIGTKLGIVVFSVVVLLNWTIFDIENFAINVAVLVMFLEKLWFIIFSKPERPKAWLIKRP